MFNVLYYLTTIKKNFNELPKFISDGIEVHFVLYYQDIFKTVFENK